MGKCKKKKVSSIYGISRKDFEEQTLRLERKLEMDKKAQAGEKVEWADTESWDNTEKSRCHE